MSIRGEKQATSTAMLLWDARTFSIINWSIITTKLKLKSCNFSERFVYRSYRDGKKVRRALRQIEVVKGKQGVAGSDYQAEGKSLWNCLDGKCVKLFEYSSNKLFNQCILSKIVLKLPKRQTNNYVFRTMQLPQVDNIFQLQWFCYWIQQGCIMHDNNSRHSEADQTNPTSKRNASSKYYVSNNIYRQTQC